MEYFYACTYSVVSVANAEVCGVSFSARFQSNSLVRLIFVASTTTFELTVAQFHAVMMILTFLTSAT